MKKYDVFKSQGGYGVALGIYLDCPVVGSIRWLETKEQAEEFAKNQKAFDRAYADWEEKIPCMSLDEIENATPPKRENYNLNVGITI